jgi:hypothetical protein
VHVECDRHPLEFILLGRLRVIEAGDAAGHAAPGAITSTADLANEIKNGGIAIVKTWSFGEQYGVVVFSPAGQELTPNEGRNILERWAGVPEQDLPPDPMDQSK